MAKVARALPAVLAVAAFAVQFIPGYGQILAVALTAASIGISYLQRPDVAADSATRGISGKLRAAGTIPRSFVFGLRWGTPGSLVYANTWGEEANTPNFYLVQVIALCDLPGLDLLSLTVNGEAVVYNPANVFVAPGNPFNGYVITGDRMLVKYYDGSQTVADPGLVAAFGSHPDFPYQSTRVGRGVAYAICVFGADDEDGNPWGGAFPEVKFNVGNLPFYDPRHDSTAGGSGSQRFNDRTTWQPTGNPIVIAYNVLRGMTYANAWFYGLQNVGAARLPYAEWAAAMNTCDILVPKAGGGTEPQYRAGGEIFVGEEPASAAEKLLKSCNGTLAECGGIYKVKAGGIGAPIFSFDDGAILATDAQVFAMFPSIAEQINGVTARYASEAEDWELKDAPPRYYPTFEAQDGGWRRTATATYECVSNHRQVQRLMHSAINEARRFRKHTLPLPPEARVLEPLDVVAWTSERNGYSAKKFRVDYVELLESLDVIVSLTEVDPTDYDWSTDLELPVSDGVIKPIRPAPQPIRDFAAVGTERNNVAGILISWDPSVPQINGIRFQVRRASDEVMILDSQTDAWEAGSIFVSHSIVRAMTYEVRARYRPSSPRPTTWSGWLTVTTPDVAPWDFDTGELEVANLWAYAYEQAELLRQLSAAVAGNTSLFNRIEAISERLQVTYEDFVAEFNSVRFAAASDRETIAGEITTLNARLTRDIDATATALQALTVRVTATEDGLAIVSQSITLLEAELDNVGEETDANSAALLLMEARVDEINGVVTSQAAMLLALDAQVGESTAEGRFAMIATANQAGARVRLALMARASINESFEDAGLYIESKASPSGNYSQIVMKANRFALVDNAGGTEIVPFLYSNGTLNLTANVRIQGNLIVTGSINWPQIREGGLSDIGQSVQGFVRVAFAWATLNKVEVETVAGGIVLIDVQLSWRTVPGSRPAVPQWRVSRGGVIIAGTSGIGGAETNRVNFWHDRAPITGKVIYSLQAKTTTSGVAAEIRDITFRVASHKRGRRKN